jgi:hypothetical protein
LSWVGHLVNAKFSRAIKCKRSLPTVYIFTDCASCPSAVAVLIHLQLGSSGCSQQLQIMGPGQRELQLLWLSVTSTGAC